MKEWKYYNHAMIPTVAPHERIDVEPLIDKQFWREKQESVVCTMDFGV